MHIIIDDGTGQALTYQEILEKNNQKIHNLQQIAYTHFSETLKDIVFCSVGELSKKEYLVRHIQLLDYSELLDLAKKLFVITDRDELDSNLSWFTLEESFLLELVLEHLLPRQRHIDECNMMSLYPTETLLWDTDQLPISSKHASNTGNEVLSLPKLNLQFLSIHDYLLRNFQLFRLERYLNDKHI